MKSKTDWKRVKAMTESDIITAAKSAPDAQPLMAVQLKKFKRVQPIKDVDVRMIRNKLHLSQEQFAGYFGVSVRTIQEWEQHRRTPTSTARNFLKVIQCEPKVVQKALAGMKPAELEINLVNKRIARKDPGKSAGYQTIVATKKKKITSGLKNSVV